MWKGILALLLLAGNAQAQTRPDKALIDLEVQSTISFLDLWLEVSNELEKTCDPKDYKKYTNSLTRVTKHVVARQETAEKSIRSLDRYDRPARQVVSDSIDRDLQAASDMQKTLQEKLTEMANYALK